MAIRRVLAGALVCLVSATAVADESVLRAIEDTFVRLHEEVGPCVVNIVTRGPAVEDNSMQDFFRQFGVPEPEGAPPQRSNATGSGFIYDKQGHIITNNHVIDGADQIKVRLYNMNLYTAKVVGTDPETDIAVIKIEPTEELPIARLGDSDALKVGQFAIAIGSPRGLEGSVSFGHVSALGRENLEGLASQGLQFQNLIQTDAAINLGNSGGPLCNLNGEVVGMNTAIVFGANSIGFAIPINSVKSVGPVLISGGRVVRGFLGVRIKDAREFVEAMALPDGNGALVHRVEDGTPAAAGGIERYDVLRTINGENIKSATDLVRRISFFKPGSTVNIGVWRDGKPVELPILLAERPSANVSTPRVEERIHGLQVETLKPEDLKRLNLPEETKGVLVTDVSPGTPAEEAGLTVGCVILEVAKQPVTTPEEFKAQLEKAGQERKSVLFSYVAPGSTPDITVLELP